MEWETELTEVQARSAVSRLKPTSERFQDLHAQSKRMLESYADVTEKNNATGRPGGWHHYVHVIVHDLRASFYDPRWQEPGVQFVRLTKATSPPALADKEGGLHRDTVLAQLTNKTEIVVHAQQTARFFKTGPRLSTT